LRIVEDYARFVLDDAFLTGELKRLRHDFANCLKRIPSEMLVVCRDTLGDVGTEISTASEMRREDALHVAAANFKRVEEALRSLEEFGKLIIPDWAGACQRLRYRAYTLEQAVLNTAMSAGPFADARLYVVIDGRSSPEEFEQLVGELVAGGVHILQLRDKSLDDRTLLDRARILRRLTDDNSVFFIMNDRPDLAALAGADGVHVGQEELSVRDCRRIIGPWGRVGVSTHSIEQARQAMLDGADYLGVGPVFASGTKQFTELPGLDLVRQVAAEIRLPAFAIGGITAENLPRVLSAGLSRVAVSGGITNSPSPGHAAQALLKRLTE
jgi:thiamine-phosphate pyrophosphorylase